MDPCVASFEEESGITVIRPKSKFEISSVTEFGINESNSVVFFTNSNSSQVRQYEYAFNLTESECFSSNSITVLMPNFDLVIISGELLYIFAV